MPDERKHRGPDHADRLLFAESRVPALKAAVDDLSWLIGRGYAEPSAVKIVGDRHVPKRRQREAVRTASCRAAACTGTAGKLLPIGGIGDSGVRIDGFNVIITVEAALSGAAVFRCRDGCMRDIASIHGSYRQVEETRRAISAVGTILSWARIRPVTWLLDAPVSNSGRLGRLIESMAREQGWEWEVALVRSADPVLKEPGPPVATSDSPILDACAGWVNLARAVVEQEVPDAWIVCLE